MSDDYTTTSRDVQAAFSKRQNEWAMEARELEHRAEAAEAERDRLQIELDRREERIDRLAARVAELEAERDEWRRLATEDDGTESRLQQATEALRKIERKAEQPVYETQVVEIGVIAHSALAALAGEDDRTVRPGEVKHGIRNTGDCDITVLAGEDEKPPNPQREGDYL